MCTRYVYIECEKWRCPPQHPPRREQKDGGGGKENDGTGEEEVRRWWGRRMWGGNQLCRGGTQTMKPEKRGEESGGGGGGADGGGAGVEVPTVSDRMTASGGCMPASAVFRSLSKASWCRLLRFSFLRSLRSRSVSSRSSLSWDLVWSFLGSSGSRAKLDSSRVRESHESARPRP